MVLFAFYEKKKMIIYNLIRRLRVDSLEKNVKKIHNQHNVIQHNTTEWNYLWIFFYIVSEHEIFNYANLSISFVNYDGDIIDLLFIGFNYTSIHINDFQTLDLIWCVLSFILSICSIFLNETHLCISIIHWTSILQSYVSINGKNENNRFC